VDGALVVLREIDLNPGQPARANRVQRVCLRKLRERARRPVPNAAGIDQTIHDVDQHGGSLSPELDDAEILAVRFGRIHAFGHVRDAPAPDLHLHLFIAEEGLAGLAIREQQRVVVACGQEVVQERGVEKNITIQDHESLIKQRSTHP
jgi:hypothetical protein